MYSSATCGFPVGTACAAMAEFCAICKRVPMLYVESSSLVGDLQRRLGGMADRCALAVAAGCSAGEGDVFRRTFAGRFELHLQGLYPGLALLAISSSE